MNRTVNGGGASGLATTGCDLAKGSPKGGGPIASTTRVESSHQPCPRVWEARVQSEGSAPSSWLTTQRTRDRPAQASAAWERSYVLQVRVSPSSW